MKKFEYKDFADANMNDLDMLIWAYTMLTAPTSTMEREIAVQRVIGRLITHINKRQEEENRELYTRIVENR